MLNTKIQNAINSQINAEIYSSYLYLAMSAYCAENGLSGFANWMKIQAQEELSHAKFFFDYVLEHGAHIELDAIEKPEVSWNSILEVFEKTLEHEKYVTSRINDLMTLSIEEKDHATASFLNPQFPVPAVDDLLEREAHPLEAVHHIDPVVIHGDLEGEDVGDDYYHHCDHGEDRYRP